MLERSRSTFAPDLLMARPDVGGAELLPHWRQVPDRHHEAREIHEGLACQETVAFFDRHYLLFHMACKARWSPQAPG